MAYKYEQVEEVTIEIKGWVIRYAYDDGTEQYDWRTQNDEADEWFETAEEAKYDMLNHY